MSQTNKGIRNSWSLIEFRRIKGEMKIGNFVNQNTGEEFTSCIFIDQDGSKTFVSFSSNLGTLTPAQVASQKNELQVVELNSGTFKLCKQGSPDNAWQSVDI